MDNLLAIICSHQNAKKTAVINQLSKFIEDKKSIHHNVYSENQFVCLTKFSNNIISKNNSLSLRPSMEAPIIGNLRIDNKDFLTANSQVTSSTKEQTYLEDDALFFTGYKNLGNSFFSKVKGNFQSIFWDQTSEKLYAAIDAFSSRSLFYLELNDMLYIASDTKILKEVTDTNLTINKVAISQWLAGRPNPNISMFNEISKLPAGHYLEYTEKSGVKLTKFWDIDPNFSVKYNNLEAYKSHFYDLLKTSVKNRLATESHTHKNTIFCQMSGGMDSTSVTAVTKELLDDNHQPLHTLSHRYKNTRSCDESNNINDMINTLNLTHQHYIDLDKYETSSFSTLYPTDFDSPGIVFSPKYDQELALMHSLGANVLLTGNGGDETCWGHSASYKSRLYKGELSVINEVINACHKLNEPVMRSLYKLFMPNNLQNIVKLARKKPVNTNEFPSWLSPQALINVTEENKLLTNPFSATFEPAKHARYHGINTTSTYNAMRSYQKIASNYGIDVRHPFFDTDIVAFSFAIPEKLLLQGIYPKWLLRQTMQTHLPESVCWNKHKVVFDHHFANLVRSNKVELRKLLSHSGLQDLGLIDNAILLHEFDAIVENENSHLNVDMLYTILTQLWFQSHCI